jgi:hypothetical protein
MKNKKKTVLTIDDKIIGEVYLDNIKKGYLSQNDN